MLFVKKDEDLKQFQNDHPNRQEVLSSDVLRISLSEAFAMNIVCLELCLTA